MTRPGRVEAGAEPLRPAGPRGVALAWPTDVSPATPPDAAPEGRPARPTGVRALGLGLVTGAADDDPSAVGTYVSAGARLGPSILWLAPLAFPMMFAVVYLSSKLGQVTGKGLFQAIRDHYGPGVARIVLIGVLVGNTIEAGADIGGLAAAIQLLVPLPAWSILILTSASILALQVWGSYRLIRDVFRWLALTLLAYAGAALLSNPDWGDVARGTFLPRIRLDQESLTLIVAVLGASLSAYLYEWQSNQEVEEEMAMGRTRLEQRVGATHGELARSRRDILLGMLFSTLIMYSIMLAAGATLYAAGKPVSSAADAAAALRPLAGEAAALLFAVGIIGVGFVAVPIMTSGAAYGVCQAFGWRYSLGARPSRAPAFYGAIAVFTAIATGMNFLGVNPMRALVLAGVVQGFSTPPLLVLIMLMTRRRKVMGKRVNHPALAALGWLTVAVVFAASAGLVVSWIL